VADKTKASTKVHLYKSVRTVSGVGALGYGVEDRGFEYRQVLGIITLTTKSSPALWPTQLPIQWVPGAPSLGVKLPEREADHSPPSSAEVKNAWI